MKKAIKDHLGDFAAILALVLLAAGVGGYILSQQRFRFPFVQDKPYVVNAEMENAQAVQPGQGQTVRSAGVQIGLIGKVRLKDGKALVAMELKPKYKGYIRQDASALLRSRTGLKDMFIDVDPGKGKSIKNGGTIPSSNTAPDVNPDQILASLDTDTRAYLKLLIAGGGKGLKGRAFDLRETMKALGPTNADLARLNTAVAERKTNLKHLINRYGVLTEYLGKSDRDIVRFVREANGTFGSLASENQNLARSVHKLPGALNVTRDTLAKLDTFSGRLRPTLTSLRPAVRQLDPANKAVLPFVKDATPRIRDQIRPFTRIAPGYVRDLGNAATSVTAATPDLTTSLDKLNRFVNIGAFNPGGAQGLTGNPTTDRNRQEGYLYWAAWLATNTNSLFSTADASGPLRRITIGGLSCSGLTSIIQASGLPNQVPLQGVVDTLGQAGVCLP